MGRIFKRSDERGAPYYVEWRVTQPDGRRVKRKLSTGQTSAKVARDILAKHEADAAVRSHGLVDPVAERIQQQAARPVAEHVEDFRATLEGAGNTAKHVRTTTNHVDELIGFGTLKTAGGITADIVTRWSAKLLREGMAARTVQSRLTSAKAFTKWLTAGEKLPRDPLAMIAKPNPDADRRVERRMLKPNEWRWLIGSLDGANDFRGTAPAVRAAVYRLAIQTGLRSAEIRSLTRGSFNLTGDRPYVRIAGRSAKNRRVGHQSIDATLAAVLRDMLATKMPGAPAFDLPGEWAMATMLREDLERARRSWLRSIKGTEERTTAEATRFLAPVDDAGHVLDFHALRHTCGAWLAMRGVQPKVIQSVMRHSSINLTLDTYGHLIDGAEAAAVTANADLTAVGSIIEATIAEPMAQAAGGEVAGTVGPIGSTASAMQPAPVNVSSGQPSGSRGSNMGPIAAAKGGSGANRGGTKRGQSVPSGQKKTPRFAGRGDAGRGVAGDSGRGIRTPDTRIMIPLL